ncbi:MAG: glycosyltransferase [Hyphomicrobiaceae bacterium]|nr:glycosyltransferase [Hyphomicrobiaceae bacterium]
MSVKEKWIEPPETPVSFAEKWSVDVQLKLLVYFSICFIAASAIPNTIWDPSIREITYVIGALGIWRYAWWFNHAIRAVIYGRWAYPAMARKAADLWDSGWRPRHVHIQMTTFREERDTAEAVIRSLCRELRDIGVPGTIWLGSSEPEDERVIAEYLQVAGADLDVTLRIIRQNQPGKRVAIALILRAMSRAGLKDDDLVIFMDGDFVLAPGNMRRCLPLFAIDPELHALTTDEEVVCKGPWWMQSWLAMRFAQRRLAMQSHALSGRVLTLTGRMSVFRATHITSHEFIRLQEADYLNHWLWGTFRFLSGDDKSTWYCLLRHGVKMLYVPDATGYTIEIVHGSGYTRMVENLRRWSGNMLRNGARAIALGPRRMPVFIWWCVVDQRIAMWTMLVSPVLAVAATGRVGSSFLMSYILYVAVTRMLLSMVLFTYARRVDLNFAWTLYANQLLNAAVKVYMIWRLSKQKWANRGNQTQGLGGRKFADRARDAMASYLTFVSVSALFLSVIVYTQLLETPDWHVFWKTFNF